MAKLVLEFEDDYDFQLIGICSHVKDYRICWELNQHIELDLVKEDNFSIYIKGNEQTYPFYKFHDEESLKEYYLIGNRGELGLLIPEESEIDYFLMIKGHIVNNEIEDLSKKISKIKSVLTTILIDTSQLKSKENLVF